VAGDQALVLLVLSALLTACAVLTPLHGRRGPGLDLTPILELLP
jgi:hypothetical protein